ncbi:MAG TPA: CoA-binding protein, partial [Candidatus Eisenbacteria bacterium]
MSLERLLRPRSIAVVGASRRRDAIGGAVLRNLIDQGFQGPVYPVNPTAPHVQSVPAYPDVESIPGEVDLAVIVVPAARVLEAAEACVRKGVKALVVISAGFKETGDEGRKREEALCALARRHGVRLVGPNCLGLL